MAKKYPILVLIPHGGYAVPEELSGLEEVGEFDLFVQADTCANDLFRFDDRVSGTLDTAVSRLFVDIDRPYQDISTTQPDGVVKVTTLFGKKIFRDDAFPDEIAIANILRRYYFPYHNAIETMISAGGIKTILECHTAMPVGPSTAHDAGMPRATVTVENGVTIDNKNFMTCGAEMAGQLMESLMRQFAQEDQSVVPSEVKTAPPRSFMIKKYGPGKIPYLRLSLSKSLFLNDRHFSHDYLRVDELRIGELRERIWTGIERWFEKSFR